MAAGSVSLAEHLAALRAADKELADERDRRYAEVAAANAMALKIKEQADSIALDLAREIQKYKDEKANQLREQIGAERNLYVTKEELQPIKDRISSRGGEFRGIDTAWKVAIGIIGILSGLLALYVTLGTLTKVGP